METPTLPRLDIRADVFLDKSTVIYGKSRSGKSTLIKDIMMALNREIDQCIVICPEVSCHDYDETVGKIFVHHRPSDEIFHKLLQRQLALRMIYLAVNNVTNLKALFAMVASPADLQKWKQITQVEMSPNVKDSTKVQINDIKIKYLKGIIRKNSNSPKFASPTLPQPLRIVLEYLDINPRLLIIIDDCTEMLDDLKKNPDFLGLFTKGRHYYTTLLFAVHSDKPLRPESRKSIMNSIFTDAKSAGAYFERGSNDFNKREKKRFLMIIDSVFNKGDPNNYCKLFYDSLNEQCYEILATVRPDFQFGHHVVREFNNRLAKQQYSLDDPNPILKNMLGKVR